MPSTARISRRSYLAVLLASFALIIPVLSLCSGSGFADDTSERRVKIRISPTYPEIARRMGLRGVVRLQIVVAPNGNVKETKVIGGHPILVTAAEDAVKKWKFEPSSVESTGTVELSFDPSTH